MEVIVYSVLAFSIFFHKNAHMVERTTQQENLDAARKFGAWFSQAEHDPRRLTDEQIITELTRNDAEDVLQA